MWFLILLSWMVFAITDFAQMCTYFRRLFSFPDGLVVNAVDWVFYGRTYALFFLLAFVVSTPAAESFWKRYRNTAAVKMMLCGIMCVERGRSETDPIFNNPGIRERNEGIACLADGQSIFYLNINEAVTDENGNLDSDYTWDDVHLLGKYNVLWMDYFCRHGIIKE